MHVSTRVKLQDVDLVPQHTQVELEIEHKVPSASLLVSVLCVSCGHASVSFRNRFEGYSPILEGKCHSGRNHPPPPTPSPKPCILSHVHSMHQHTLSHMLRYYTHKHHCTLNHYIQPDMYSPSYIQPSHLHILSTYTY